MECTANMVDKRWEAAAAEKNLEKVQRLMLFWLDIRVKRIFDPDFAGEVQALYKYLPKDALEHIAASSRKHHCLKFKVLLLLFPSFHL